MKITRIPKACPYCDAVIPRGHAACEAHRSDHRRATDRARKAPDQAKRARRYQLSKLAALRTILGAAR